MILSVQLLSQPFTAVTVLAREEKESNVLTRIGINRSFVDIMPSITEPTACDKPVRRTLALIYINPAHSCNTLTSLASDHFRNALGFP
jgi:hypothetical protein